jgi:hypothetical protein
MIILFSLGAFLLPVAALAVFAFAALRWGVDSRDGSTDPHSPDRPVGIS